MVSNPGDVSLTGVVVRDVLPPQLTFASASDGGQLINGQVVWNIGTLQPRQDKTVQVQTKCAELVPQVVNVATATADGGLQARSEAALEIRGLPALRLELIDRVDPVEVAKNTTYQITVTNTGSLPSNQVEVIAQVPVEMKIVKIQGPSAYHINGPTIMFDPLDGLQPNAAFNYSIEVQALKPGDVRFQAWLKGAALTKPVYQQESTNIIEAPIGPRPSPGPAPMPPGPAPMPPGPAPMPPGPSPAPPPSTGMIAPTGIVPARMPIASSVQEPALAPVGEPPLLPLR